MMHVPLELVMQQRVAVLGWLQVLELRRGRVLGGPLVLVPALLGVALLPAARAGASVDLKEG